MIYVAGIDIGASFSKAVILGDRKVIAYHILPSGRNYRETSEKVMQAALDKAKLGKQDIALTLATGYGSATVSFANQQVTEISCQAKGIRHLLPSARAIIDVGGQSTKVIKLDEAGRAVDFVVSEKCAAGSGRFLQVIARVLGVPLEEIGPLSLQAKKVVKLTTSCAVFSESEAISRIAEGENKEDILAGVHAAIASKIVSLVERARTDGDCSMTGGGAKDIGLVKAVEEKIACRLMVPEEPQITAALGAALIAWDRVQEKANAH
jgi:(R)-2-hydroxyacyl-CoA dehydratese activating ATPase